jgi:ketosteroid isomerase-like protein
MQKVLPGERANIVKRFLTDTRTADEFASYFTENAFFQFGNSPPLIGRKAIWESSIAFRQQLKSVTHEIKSMWEVGEVVICEMDVTYVRHDEKVLRLPCTDTIRFQGEKLQELRVYMDISPLFS